MYADTKTYTASSDFLRLEIDLTHQENQSSSKQMSRLGALISILIVDDDEDMRGYIHDCLSGYFKSLHIMEAGNGKEAFKVLQNIHPDLLITDLNMPVMNGLELVSEIVSSFGNREMPVLIVSGKDQHPATHPKVRELTNWDVLKKPFSEETLVLACQQLLTT